MKTERIKPEGGAKALKVMQGTKNLIHKEKLPKWCPSSIVPFLRAGEEKFGSDARNLTVMFCSLDLDLSSSESDEGMNKIQRVFETVQQQVYR